MSALGKHKTTIEWTHLPGYVGATLNPIRALNKETRKIGHFCVHVSDGCRNCYAERLQPRFGNPIRFRAQDRDKVDVFLDEKTLRRPLKWKKPHAIFLCDMTDLFEEGVPDEWIDRIFAIMADCPRHIFFVLTKRAKRMREYISGGETPIRVARWLKGNHGMYAAESSVIINNWPLPNVWKMVSVENQDAADERIPELLATPAAVRFVSAEPLLGPVNFKNWLCPSFNACQMKNTSQERIVGLVKVAARGVGWHGLDWVICGGESGPGARPMHPDWARGVRDQCAAAGVPFFFKQHGAWVEVDPEEMPSETIESLEIEGRLDTIHGALTGPATMLRVGKKAAGARLDGREHRECPR